MSFEIIQILKRKERNKGKGKNENMEKIYETYGTSLSV
jgi:hypothetical protein